jgi:hypothetical protein
MKKEWKDQRERGTEPVLYSSIERNGDGVQLKYKNLDILIESRFFNPPHASQ